MNMHKEKGFFVFSLFFACAGLIASIISVVLLLLAQSAFASILCNISTIISIVLGAESIIYTFFSGKKTLENLDDIKTQYASLVNKINHELSKDNYDEENIAAVNEMISESVENHK